MTKIWFFPPDREDMKKISWPFADQAGAPLHQVEANASGSLGVRLICSLPSAFMLDAAFRVVRTPSPGRAKSTSRCRPTVNRCSSRKTILRR